MKFDAKIKITMFFQINIFDAKIAITTIFQVLKMKHIDTQTQKSLLQNIRKNFDFDHFKKFRC